MTHHIEAIKKLAAAAGYSTNPMEMTPLWILENEIDMLTSKIQCKTQLGKLLDENLEKKRLELKAEKEYADRFASEAHAEVAKFKEKNMILIQYMSILQTEEFLPNKLLRQVHTDEQEYYIGIKSMIEKARAVHAELEKLQELQAKCDQLRQQTAK